LSGVFACHAENNGDETLDIALIGAASSPAFVARAVKDAASRSARAKAKRGVC
jgi:hypothetical protein